MRAILQEMLNKSVLDMSLKITNLKTEQHLPGANALTHSGLDKIDANFTTKFWIVFFDSFDLHYEKKEL